MSLPAAAVLQTLPSQAPLTALDEVLWGQRLLWVEIHLEASHPLGAVQSDCVDRRTLVRRIILQFPIPKGRASCHPGLSRNRTQNEKFLSSFLGTYSKIFPNWSASEFPQKRGLR
jgi:hypothetical protein